MKHPPRAVIARDEEGHFLGIEFHCPGCHGAPHIVPINSLPAGEMESDAIRAISRTSRWDFSKNYIRPTFTQEYKLEFEMDIGAEQPLTYCCHSRISNGRILYLPDCTHAMAGQLMDLPDILESPIAPQGAA